MTIDEVRKHLRNGRTILCHLKDQPGRPWYVMTVAWDTVEIVNDRELPTDVRWIAPDINPNFSHWELLEHGEEKTVGSGQADPQA